MQIKTAQVTRNYNFMRRFTVEHLFQQLTEDFGKQAAFVFNRLYLNTVTVLDYYRIGNLDNIVVEIACSAQRVDISNKNLKLIDPWIKTTNNVMILSRNINAELAHGSVYAHTCPSCGAPFGDTTDITCRYCQSIFNNMQNEWIVSDLLTPEKYAQFKKNLKTQASEYKSSKAKIDASYAVRDYVLNNLLVFFARDNDLTWEDKGIAYKVSQKLRYNPKKLNGLFDLAKNGQLSLRLPEDPKEAAKVRQIIEKVLHNQGNISQNEEDFLTEIDELIHNLNKEKS